MNYKDFLIFDFDGTIVQSMQVVFGILKELAVEKGFRKVTENDVVTFRNKGSREVIASLKIPFYKLPKVVKAIRKGLEEEMEQIKVVDGLTQVLNELKRRNIGLGILTSNSRESVDKFLSKHNWSYFDFIFSGSSMFGKGKVLKKLMKERNINKEQIIYIGDETRDVEAAKECGIRAAAVTWGYSSRKPLSETNPDWIIDEPKQLLEILS
jgi:phosphoglycolate phosphatase